MAGRQRGHAHGVHIVLDRLARAFFGRLKQRAHVDVKTQVGKGGGHHFGAAVVPVLAKFADHDTWAPALISGKLTDLFFELVPACGAVISCRVDTGDLLCVSTVAPK